VRPTSGSSFAELDGWYRATHDNSTLSTLTLAHLGNPFATGVNISSTFPLAAEILGMLQVLTNSAPFQAYFEDDLTQEEIILRVSAFRVVMRLLDHYVRSSVVFSPDTANLAPLLKCADPSHLKSDLQSYINDNWKILYSKLLQQPSVVLEDRHVKARIAQAVAELESPAELRAVAESVRKLFAEHTTLAQRLAQIVAAAILSPQGLWFASAVLCCDVRGRKVHVVAESGTGDMEASLLILPCLLQSDGAVILKPHVYKIYE
jgi:hypothetical protein